MSGLHESGSRKTRRAGIVRHVWTKANPKGARFIEKWPLLPDRDGRLDGMKKMGFLSFGHWTPSLQSRAKPAADVLLRSIDFAVEAERLGMDGPYFRIHHFARQLASPFPLLAAVGAKTRKSKLAMPVFHARTQSHQPAQTAVRIAMLRDERSMERTFCGSASNASATASCFACATRHRLRSERSGTELGTFTPWIVISGFAPQELIPNQAGMAGYEIALELRPSLSDAITLRERGRRRLVVECAGPDN